MPFDERIVQGIILLDVPLDPLLLGVRDRRRINVRPTDSRRPDRALGKSVQIQISDDPFEHKSGFVDCVSRGGTVVFESRAYRDYPIIFCRPQAVRLSDPGLSNNSRLGYAQ